MNLKCGYFTVGGIMCGSLVGIFVGALAVNASLGYMILLLGAWGLCLYITSRSLMAGSGCNAYQIRKIYAIGGALGMVKRNEEDDLLHELVEGMTGKKSIKALTYGEACKVIGELEGRQGTPSPRKSGKPLRKTAPGHTSEGQRRKVWALMYRLQDASPSKAPLGDRLCAIIKKELGMDAFPKDPFAWISYKDGNKLVEVLKGYVKTAQKSRGDADG